MIANQIFTRGGSMAISGKADLIMQLKKERGKTSAELSIEGRDIEYQNLLIDFDSNKFEWTNEGRYNQAKYSKEKKEILDFLENHKSDLFSPKEIAKGLGKKTTREVNNVTRLLRKLLAVGDILQPKEIKGKYSCIPF
jgi:DNA integrity scanning protein DisA with diadenylate cyclase activity